MTGIQKIDEFCATILSETQTTSVYSRNKLNIDFKENQIQTLLQKMCYNCESPSRNGLKTLSVGTAGIFNSAPYEVLSKWGQRH